MPFGTKHDARSGLAIDFHQVFTDILQPAAVLAGLQLVRPDPDAASGWSLTKQTLGGLMSSDVVVAEITTWDPNVMYEVGVRHALSRGPTVLITTSPETPPFDLGYVRLVRYDPRNLEAARAQLSQVLGVAARSSEGSPIYEFFPTLRVELPGELLSSAAADAANVTRATARVGEPSPLDGLRTFRGRGDWDGLIQAADSLSDQAKGDPQVQQLLALALNRRAGPGDQERALALMRVLVSESPNDPEVLGILGRVYKDRWKATGADADLREATRAYAQAFALQPTDYYAGFNAASLLFLQATPEANADLARLLPRVNTLVVDRLGQKGPDDFWAINVATELAIIGRNWSDAREFAQRQVASRPDPWMLTVEIESLQRLGRRLTGPDSDALSQVVAILTAAAGPTGAPRA